MTRRSFGRPSPDACMDGPPASSLGKPLRVWRPRLLQNRQKAVPPRGFAQIPSACYPGFASQAGFDFIKTFFHFKTDLLKRSQTSDTGLSRPSPRSRTRRSQAVTGSVVALKFDQATIACVLLFCLSHESSRGYKQFLIGASNHRSAKSRIAPGETCPCTSCIGSRSGARENLSWYSLSVTIRQR